MSTDSRFGSKGRDPVSIKHGELLLSGNLRQPKCRLRRGERNWTLVFATLGGVTVAIATMSMPFYWELLRLEPWAICGLFASEVVALFWFGFFLFASRRYTTNPTSVSRIFVVTFTVGLLVDVGFTFYMSYHEQSAQRRALPTVATATRVDHSSGTKFRNHFVILTYQDRHGESQHGRWNYQESVEEGFPNWIGEQDQVRLVLGNCPFALEIEYDPSSPGRFWPRRFQGARHGLLFYWSLLTIVVQCFIAFYISMGAANLSPAIPLIAMGILGWFFGIFWLVAAVTQGTALVNW